jgi:segregation and condensation protein A
MRYAPTPEQGRTALASSFGASLELVREGKLELRQETAFAPIFMRGREQTSHAPSDTFDAPPA